MVARKDASLLVVTVQFLVCTFRVIGGSVAVAAGAGIGQGSTLTVCGIPLTMVSYLAKQVNWNKVCTTAQDAENQSSISHVKHWGIWLFSNGVNVINSHLQGAWQLTIDCIESLVKLLKEWFVKVLQRRNVNNLMRKPYIRVIVQSRRRWCKVQCQRRGYQHSDSNMCWTGTKSWGYPLESVIAGESVHSQWCCDQTSRRQLYFSGSGSQEHPSTKVQQRVWLRENVSLDSELKGKPSRVILIAKSNTLVGQTKVHKST